MKKVINVLLLQNGKAFFWKSIEVEDSGSTSEIIAPIISKIIKELLDIGLKIIAIVLDNENFCTALYDLLKLEYPWLIHVRCGAHSLQLCINKILEIKEIQNIVKQAEKIIETMLSKKKLRINLKLWKPKK